MCLKTSKGDRRYNIGYKITSDGVFHLKHFEGYSFPREVSQSYARDERACSTVCMEFVRNMKEKKEAGHAPAIRFFERFPLLRG